MPAAPNNSTGSVGPKQITEQMQVQGDIDVRLETLSIIKWVMIIMALGLCIGIIIAECAKADTYVSIWEKIAILMLNIVSGLAGFIAGKSRKQ